MRHACRYAIVRFRPSAELAEFANVGVVVVSASARFFGFKLLEQGSRRLFNFFDDVSPRTYRHVRALFAQELARIRDMAAHAFVRGEGDYVDRLFSALAMPSDAAMYLGPPAVALTNDVHRELQSLFERYVARSFVRAATHERLFEQSVQKLLRQEALDTRFERRMVGGEDFAIQLPLVAIRGDTFERAIKPLSLDQDSAMKLSDYGWEWVGRLKGLKRKGYLPGKILLPVRRPKEAHDARAAMSADLIEELRSIDEDRIIVVDDSANDQIIEFARAA